MMAYDPEGPVARQFVPLLVNELTSKYGIPDDALDVADYISLMIGNNRTAAEICAEVKEVVNIPIDEAFIATVFAEIQRITAAQSAPPAAFEGGASGASGAGGAGGAGGAPASAPLAQSSANSTAMAVEHSDFPEAKQLVPPSGAKSVNFSIRKQLPLGPKAAPKRGRGGVGKDYVAKEKKSFAVANLANLEKALSLSKNVTTRSRKRCNDFPNCPKRNCAFAHPHKLCFAHPNCPNGKLCEYLHPDEDAEIIAELERRRERREMRDQSQVTLCKYGILCSKELCPFGHPTPANKDAKVILHRWCKDNKNCQNAECKYAHSSPNYQAPPVARAPPAYQAPFKYSLEQCKFGKSCTNPQCTRRHATSLVPCRSGAECTRGNCTFHHPFNEECRFGLECKATPCFYMHADGREKALFQTPVTTMRAFAVPEDQVMEQAVQH